jgi:tetratricopeptide (TPR) repeat protein
MSKKSKRLKQPRNNPIPLHSRLIEQSLSHARYQMLQGDFTGAIDTCQPLLEYLPKRSSLRVEVLAFLGLAHGMLQHYLESYDAFSEALTIAPDNAELWYNHGLACRYLTRVGQSVRDFERAIELLDTDQGDLAQKFAEELAKSREEVQHAMELQGVITFKPTEG